MIAKKKYASGYKGYMLVNTTSGICWSDAGGWLDCVFDSEQTAKNFIDQIEQLKDNLYEVIKRMQEKANETTGLVTMEIINEQL